MKVLDSIAIYMKDNPNVKVSIVGFSEGFNFSDDKTKVTMVRANGVAAYFVSKGIDKSRLIVSNDKNENSDTDNPSTIRRKLLKDVELRLIA